MKKKLIKIKVTYKVWDNAISWLFNSVSAWILTAIISFISAYFFIPTNVNPLKQVIYGVIGVLSGLIIFLISIYLIHLENYYKNNNKLNKQDINQSEPTQRIFSDMVQAFEKTINHMGNALENVTQVIRLSIPAAAQVNTSTNIENESKILQESFIEQMERELNRIEEKSHTIGEISMGSPQTFTGLIIDEDPLFIRIPMLGYVVIMFNFISNHTLEVKFMANVKTTPPFKQAIITIFFSDSQKQVPFLIPAGNKYLSQVSSINLDKWCAVFSEQKEINQGIQGGLSIDVSLN